MNSMPETTHTLSQEIDAAMEWWRAAGVDYDYADDATAWLTEPQAKGPQDKEKNTDEHRTAAHLDRSEEDAPADSVSVPRADLLGDSPPTSLSEFHEFWLTAPGLDGIGPRGRVPPRGSSGAELMILVVEPEESDRDVLLSGPQGKLLAKMLNAMALSDDDIYLASALPRHTPMADTAAIAASGMDEVTAHHIKLAAPKRILALGGNILPLIGHDLPKDPQSLREINLVNPPMPLLVSKALDSMMAMPQLKARFWRRWIEWSAER